MGAAYVVSQDEALGVRESGDSAVVMETIGPLDGCELLTQRVIHFSAGRSHPRRDLDHDDLLFVVSGAGTVELPTGTHPLEPGTAVHLAAGESAVVENTGADDLVIVSVLIPPVETDVIVPLNRQDVLRLEDRAEQRADEKRTYRVLFGAETGCTQATQFVGFVEPFRAPDHSHPYDEVGYVLAGTGFAHMGGDPIPIGPGSCFHLPRDHVHCIENSGPDVMQILGVFHPAESPAARSYDAAAAEAATT